MLNTTTNNKKSLLTTQINADNTEEKPVISSINTISADNPEELISKMFNEMGVVVVRKKYSSSYRSKKYQESKNKVTHKTLALKRYYDNKDKIRTSQRDYYYNNKDKVKARMRAYYLKHKDEILAKRKLKSNINFERTAKKVND
jgi:hypothetical protein